MTLYLSVAALITACVLLGVVIDETVRWVWREYGRADDDA